MTKKEKRTNQKMKCLKWRANGTKSFRRLDIHFGIVLSAFAFVCHSTYSQVFVWTSKLRKEQKDIMISFYSLDKLYY